MQPKRLSLQPFIVKNNPYTQLNRILIFLQPIITLIAKKLNMKKRTIIYWIAAIVCSAMLSSYHAGPAAANGWDCTGAESDFQNPTGCSTGGGCHSNAATPGINVSVELDSAGIPTTHYKGGMTYIVKIKGVNTTSSNLPFYGFQLGCITGTNSVTTPTPTGSWSSSLPSGTHVAPPHSSWFTVPVVEQSYSLSPTSGTGGNGTVYSQSISWTAPLSGTGTISMWLALNAVNGNSNADAGDLWNTTHLAISELGFTGINDVAANSFSLNVYPNPAQTHLNFSYSLIETSNVSAQLYDLEGKVVINLMNESQNAGEKNISIPLSENIQVGIYLLKVNINDSQILKKVIISH